MIEDIYGLVVLLTIAAVIVIFGYVLIRAMSIAYYRTRAEYDHFNRKRNGDRNNV